MKKLICILITLFLLSALAACSAGGDNTEETASAAAEQSAAVSESETTEAAEEETAEYVSSYGAIAYPAIYQEDYVISEREENSQPVVAFDATVDGTDYNLFNLVLTDEETDWFITDEAGNKQFVTVEMNELDIAELPQEQQDKLFALQEGVNVILEHLQA